MRVRGYEQYGWIHHMTDELPKVRAGAGSGLGFEMMVRAVKGKGLGTARVGPPPY